MKRPVLPPLHLALDAQEWKDYYVSLDIWLAQLETRVEQHLQVQAAQQETLEVEPDSVKERK